MKNGNSPAGCLATNSELEQSKTRGSTEKLERQKSRRSYPRQKNGQGRVKGDRKPFDDVTHRKLRSALRNGSMLLPGCDARLPFVRLFKDCLERLIEHCGGRSTISETQLMMCYRGAYLEAELIFMAAKNVRMRELGEEPSIEAIDAVARWSGAQRRCVEPLGWHRNARDVTPSLRELMRNDTEEVDAA